MYSAKIICDSLSPNNSRLTTMEVVFPRFVLAEFNTHRMLSKNSASSRAIPVEKIINMVQENPFIPSYWGKNQKGMQAEQELTPDQAEQAKISWLKARDYALECAREELKIGVHKQITNRLLEPFLWHTCIVTATDWSNFFHLRNHKDAQPEIKTVAALMEKAYNDGIPLQLNYGEYHRPYIYLEDKESLVDLNHVSIGRCARVSYLTHDGKRDHNKDIELYDRLFDGGHMSPAEHVARPMQKSDLKWYEKFNTRYHLQNKYSANFKGWLQYRKTIPGEYDILGTRMVA